MALKANTMDVELASAVHEDMKVMVQEEKKLREWASKLVSSYSALTSSF